MDYNKMLNNHKEYFNSGETLTYNFRIVMLKKLREAIIKNHDKIKIALYNDLSKSFEESYLTEIGLVLNEINYHIKNLNKWMKIKKVKTPLSLFKAKSYIYKEPLGTVLIISPWNYPFQLAISPLIGAISAGNTAVIKPSLNALNTANIIKSMLDDTFSDKYIKTLLIDDLEADKVTELEFDHIFFTGSTRVGKIIMKKASDNLVPLTLELGGKSPVIINDFKNIDLAAKRVAYGKLINAGQTCIAPDYVLIRSKDKDEFVKSYIKYVHNFYGSDVINNSNYPKIINKYHLDRLIKLTKTDKLIYGGEYNEFKLSPTLIDNVTFESEIMKDEIFGPILPIITYDNVNDLIKTLKNKEKPLALYLFTNSKNIINQITSKLSFGGMTINDTLMHFANENLPFGGVGNSGMGSYHGYYSFKTFSHYKSVLKRSEIDLRFRYHPINKKDKKIIERFLK